MKGKRKLFLSYARQDQDFAKRLSNDLEKRGVDVWVDFKSLRPGQRWQRAVEKAIKSSDFFVALLSSNSVNKKGFVQKEIVKALEILEQYPEDSIFVIPVRLNECEPAHEALNDLHRVDLFPSWEDGFEAILKTVTDSDAVSVKDTPADQNDKSAQIKVYGSKKDYIRVQFILVTTGHSYEIELPVDLMVDHAIPELVKELNLPREFSNRSPISYRLVSKTQNRTLDGNLTFRQNGVQDGEIIGLNVDMMAG